MEANRMTYLIIWLLASLPTCWIVGAVIAKGEGE